jgi:hypothetical protein
MRAIETLLVALACACVEHGRGRNTKKDIAAALCAAEELGGGLNRKVWKFLYSCPVWPRTHGGNALKMQTYT